MRKCIVVSIAVCQLFGVIEAVEHTLSIFANAKNKSGFVASRREDIVLSGVNGNLKELANGGYVNGNSMQGWNWLELSGSTGQATVEEWLEMRRAMGFLEGTLTCEEIISFYPNFYFDMWENEADPGQATLNFIQENYDWVKSQAEANAKTDEYWLAQLGTLRQVEGMFQGFVDSPCMQSQPSGDFSWSSVAIAPKLIQFLLINSWGDLYQIALKLKEPTKDLTERLYGVGRSVKLEHCSALVKVLPGNSDVLFAHNTWDGYEGLGPRIFKHYKFPIFDGTKDPMSGTLVFDTFFSSSPMLYSSVDDFFIINGRANLGVTETTNSLYNVKLLVKVVPQTVLSWMRSTVANQLSRSGAEWSQYFTKFHSGTYTNQWMVLDLALFQPGYVPPSGFFSVTEEVPGLVVSEDQTSKLFQDGYWKSFNSPFYPQIQQASGYQDICDSGAQNACYSKAPRSVLFDQYQGLVTNFDGMKAIMQYNNFTVDAASAGDSCQAIACRGDLEPKSPPIPMGALDAKVGSASLARASSKVGAPFTPSMFAHMGPATSSGSLPKFCWAQFDNAPSGSPKYSHTGQPECFDFDWQVFPSSN